MIYYRALAVRQQPPSAWTALVINDQAIAVLYHVEPWHSAINFSLHGVLMEAMVAVYYLVARSEVSALVYRPRQTNLVRSVAAIADAIEE